MRIDQLHLIDFKNYADAEIRLMAGINILVGVNGSGKTAILNAASIACGGLFFGFEPKRQRVIRFEEIRIAGGEIRASATVKAEGLIKVGDQAEKISWSRTIKRDTKNNDHKSLDKLKLFSGSLVKILEDPTSSAWLPIIGYYPTNRLFHDTKADDSKYKAENGKRNGYTACLSESGIKQLLTDWYTQAISDRVTKLAKEISHNDEPLANVEKAIGLLVRQLYVNDKLDVKVFPNAKHDNNLYFAIGEEEEMPLSYFSDGFKNVVFLVMDIIWRASILNPTATLEQLKTKLVGVIMIDELDLHLHLKWQGKLLPFLQELLPHVQFLITTHSPMLLTEFQCRPDIDCIYRLRDNEVEALDYDFYGADINTITKKLFETNNRNKEVIGQMTEATELAQQLSSIKDLDKLKILKGKLSEYYQENDSDMIYLTILIGDFEATI